MVVHTCKPSYSGLGQEDWELLRPCLKIRKGLGMQLRAKVINSIPSAKRVARLKE